MYIKCPFLKKLDNRFYPTIDPKSTLISTPHGSMDPKYVRLTAKVVRYWVAFVQCLSLVHSLCNHPLNQEKVELWLWWEPSLISYSLESWPTVWGSWHDLVKNTGYTQTMLILTVSKIHDLKRIITTKLSILAGSLSRIRSKKNYRDLGAEPPAKN